MDAAGARSGSTDINAGRNRIESRNARLTPIAVSVPSWPSGGESLKFIERNPTTVVTLVSVIATKFSRRLSTRADLRSLPSRIFCSVVTST